MDCLVKIYNNEKLDNLISVLRFKPQKVIFMYDSKETSQASLQALEYTIAEKISGINLEFINIDNQNLDAISQKCKKIIHSNKNCYFDITGSSELSAIGLYLSCAKNFVPIFKIDIENEKLINIYGCNHLIEQFLIPPLTIDTLLLCNGARTNGNLHPTPPQNMFKNIISFCQIVFKNLNTWKDLCLYIQNGIKMNYKNINSLDFNAPKHLKDAKLNLASEAQNMLLDIKNLGFISNLCFDSNVSFKFKDENFKKYLSDFGSWLELYSYITLKKCDLFNDVRLSVKLNWDIEPNSMCDVVNEIDVTFFYGVHPVFVSCKLSEPSTEALQELSMYPNYFGGKYSKCIVITLAHIKNERNNSFKRAKQMGIGVIDGIDIKKGAFIDVLKNFLEIKY